LAEAEPEQKAAVAEAQKAHDYAKVSAAQKAADAALQAALEKDPRSAAVAQARQAYDEKRAAKLAKVGKAKGLLEELAQVNAELEKMPTARQLDSQAAQVRKKIEAGGDPDVAKVKNEIAEAEKAIKEIPQGPDYQKLLKATSDAEAAVTAKQKDLLAADKEYQEVEKKLAETKSKLADVAKKMRQAEKAATKDEPKKDAPGKKAKAAKKAE
jgi:hypothetical protein